MAVKNNGVKAHTERLICGVPTELYSIMISDLYDPTAIPNAWKKFWSEFPKSNLPSNNLAFGVVTPIDGTSGKLHYVAGVEVSSDFVAPEGFVMTTVPSGNYLEVVHVGSIENLAPSYGEAYGVVFPQSALEMREAPHIELYNAMLNPMADDYEMGILIPVK
jgi:predicted transcriptional regulator YdeE